MIIQVTDAVGQALNHFAQVHLLQQEVICATGTEVPALMRRVKILIIWDRAAVKELMGVLLPVRVMILPALIKLPVKDQKQRTAEALGFKVKPAQAIVQLKLLAKIQLLRATQLG